MELSPTQDKDSSLEVCCRLILPSCRAFTTNPLECSAYFHTWDLALEGYQHRLGLLHVKEEVLLGERKQNELTNTVRSRLHLIFGDSSFGHSFLIVTWEHMKSIPQRAYAV